MRTRSSANDREKGVCQFQTHLIHGHQSSVDGATQSKWEIKLFHSAPIQLCNCDYVCRSNSCFFFSNGFVLRLKQTQEKKNIRKCNFHEKTKQQIAKCETSAKMIHVCSLCNRHSFENWEEISRLLIAVLWRWLVNDCKWRSTENKRKWSRK